MEGTWRKTARGITWIGVWLNIFIGMAKVIAGFVGQSRALVADGIHSFVDLSSDIGVLLGLYVARLPKDANHPYGHHRISTLIQVAIAVSIVVFGVLVCWQSLVAFFRPQAYVPAGFVVLTATLSVLVKEVLFWLTRAVALRLKSTLLLTNAWHHRTDSVTSVLTLVAVAIPWVAGAGWWFLDPLLGAALGGYMAWIGARLVRLPLNDLLDRDPGTDIINDLREHVLSTPGANGYHFFRARRTGDVFEIDLHLQVPGDISVEAGHEIAREVRRSIMEKHPEVWDVLIHIEPDSAEHLRSKGVSGVKEPQRQGCADSGD